MLTGPHPLQSLRRQLGAALAHFKRIDEAPLGKPDVVEKAAHEAEKLFQGSAKAKPNDAQVYAAARAFMAGRQLDDMERHLLACGLALRIREYKNQRPLSSPLFTDLLLAYEHELRNEDLWRLTWFNLVSSYFAYDPEQKAPDAERAGFGELQRFLERTWPLVDRQNQMSVVPDWIGVLRREGDVLRDHGAAKYAADYLAGKDDAVNTLASDLGIPESSWFWHSLVLQCVHHAIGLKGERAFREIVPRLIGLIRARPVFRDIAIAELLKRCQTCIDKSPIPALRDYVTNKDVWKNPKLRPLGKAPAWNQVSDEVWRMAVSWVNEGLLRDFFQILAGRFGTDEGRLDFWTRYLEQMSWTRLCIGSYTRMLTSNPDVRALIAREEGAYATLPSDIDAFMVQIGPYIFVEFSKTGAAAYAYDINKVPFDLYEYSYTGGTSDLRAGFYSDCVIRVVHKYGWQTKLEAELASLGIYPDDSPRRRNAPNRSSRHIDKDQ